MQFLQPTIPIVNLPLILTFLLLMAALVLSTCADLKTVYWKWEQGRSERQRLKMQWFYERDVHSVTGEPLDLE